MAKEQGIVTVDQLALCIRSYRENYLFLLGVQQEDDGSFSIVLRRSQESMTPDIRFGGTLDELIAVVKKQLVAMDDYADYGSVMKRFMSSHGHATLVVRGRLRRVLCCNVKELRQHA